jgi:hypothetical protein
MGGPTLSRRLRRPFDEPGARRKEPTLESMARRHDNGLKMLRRAENEMSRRKKKKNRGHKDVVGHVQILALPKHDPY